MGLYFVIWLVLISIDLFKVWLSICKTTCVGYKGVLIITAAYCAPALWQLTCNSLWRVYEWKVAQKSVPFIAEHSNMIFSSFVFLFKIILTTISINAAWSYVKTTMLTQEQHQKQGE